MASRQFITALVAAFTLVAAADTADAASLDESLADLFGGGEVTEDHPSVALLERVGATYDGYVFAERLPTTGAYLVETRLRWRDQNLRFPVKMRRADDTWRTDWMPSRTYTEALVSLVDGGDLVTLPETSGDNWADAGTMPDLPVVVTDSRAVTPFGAVPFGGSDELKASEPFGRHVGRWVNDVLESDPAPAGLAILARQSTPWDRLSRILLTAAGAGFFRIQLVARSNDELIAHPALAPVFQTGDKPERATSLIVAMTDETGTRFRISVGDRLLEAPDNCDGDASLCIDDTAMFAPRLAERIQAAFDGGPPDVSHVLFAADGSTPLQAALERAVAVPGALGIPPRKLYLGHTQR